MTEERMTISVTMPKRLALTALDAAANAGQRTGPESIRLDHFIILSEKSFESLLNGSQDTSKGWQRTGPGWALKADCGGAEKTPERAATPAPAAGA